MLSLFPNKAKNIFNILAKKPADNILKQHHTIFYRQKHKKTFNDDGAFHVYRPIKGVFNNGHNMYVRELKKEAQQIALYATSDRNVANKVDGIEFVAEMPGNQYLDPNKKQIVTCNSNSRMVTKTDLKGFKYVRKATKIETKFGNAILNDKVRQKYIILKKASFSTRIKYIPPKTNINYGRKQNPSHWGKGKFYEHYKKKTEITKKKEKTNEKSSKNATEKKREKTNIKSSKKATQKKKEEPNIKGSINATEKKREKTNIKGSINATGIKKPAGKIKKNTPDDLDQI